MKVTVICRALFGVLITIVLLATPAAWAQGGAAFTTINEAADGTGHCLNGPGIINCNIYDGKLYVWLNGGPVANGQTDGYYFFAVLEPGAQNAPNDGEVGNLSSYYDTYLNRTFTVKGGNVYAYSGNAPAEQPHDSDFVSDSSNPKIRLFPYLDTTNTGGEYILAICYLGQNGDNYPVDPANCKYDAFKVNQAPPPPPPVGEIDALKFCDANANGLYDPAEATLGLAGWTINFSPDPTACSGITGSSGILACTNLPVITDPYNVAEAEQAGFAHTATCLDGDCSLGPVNPVSVLIIGGDKHSVNFGNVGLSTITGRKFDDRNANGLDDQTFGVTGVKILLTGTAANGNPVNACTITDANGNYAFSNLLPGTYMVTEVQPLGTLATTAISCTQAVQVDAATCAGTINQCNSIGNTCLGAGGGLTLGFWSNKNGQALFGSDDLAEMVRLNLRNQDGTPFNPASYSAFRTWLLNATATNMAYMLSAQLAAMDLNVWNGKVSAGSLVYAPACGNTGLGNSFIGISDLILAADAQLAANGYTTADSDPVNRSAQECLKNALDQANNNKNFVVPCPTFGATCP